MNGKTFMHILAGISFVLVFSTWLTPPENIVQQQYLALQQIKYILAAILFEIVAFNLGNDKQKSENKKVLVDEIKKFDTKKKGRKNGR